MDIPLKVNVYCADGLCGQSTRVIVDKTSKQVTHLVVKEKQSPHAERIIPVDWVVETASDSIHISGTAGELKDMDDFVERRFTRVAVPTLSHTGNVFMPTDVSGSSMTDTELVPSDEERLQLGEVTLERGSQVVATDGRVGQVDELAIDPNDGSISYLVLRKGHLFGHKDVCIPVAQIDHVEKNAVYLKLNKAAVEALPALSLQRKSGSS